MNTTAEKTMGALIRAYRKERRLTQKQFGDLVGVDGQRVSIWERGSSYPTGYLGKIAKALGIPVEALPPDPKARANAEKTRLHQQAQWETLRAEYCGLRDWWLGYALADEHEATPAASSTAAAPPATASQAITDAIVEGVLGGVQPFLEEVGRRPRGGRAAPRRSSASSAPHLG